MLDPTAHPHRRYDPLRDEWILVSPHRTRRPWRGDSAKGDAIEVPRYDPGCYLCPGNQRAGGVRNPEYDKTFVFDNDFAALLPEAPASSEGDHPLLRSQGARGTCRVLCFSPRHDLTLAQMQGEDIAAVIDLWRAQLDELGSRYRWVQVFENKGTMMGASSPHPHGQLWATEHIPLGPAREDRSQRAYLEAHGRPLLCDYAQLELERGERVLIDNPKWLVVVPYWAVWPFETLVIPRRHIPRLNDIDPSERDALAEVLRELLVRYDNLFETSFPYSMGWHGAPFPAPGAADAPDDEGVRAWQLHGHFYPPLLRSATIKKFMVGYEMLGEAQRDITPEQAVARLRSLSDVHYKMQSK